MFTKLKFKFGRSAAEIGEETALTPVTVFVGPNNSGKSKVLSEILGYCSGQLRNPADVILGDLHFAPLSRERVHQTMQRFTLPGPLGDQVVPADHIPFGNPDIACYIVDRNGLMLDLQNPESDGFRHFYLRFNTLMLDGAGRIGLVNAQSAGDLQGQSFQSLQVLFKDDAKRAEVRRIVHDAFGLYFVIDPTHLGKLRIRLSPREPVNAVEERGIHAAALNFHANAPEISSYSDGVKAFTGIITAVIAGDPTILLIDEPEAFLHPSLAFKLGKEIWN